VKTMLGMGLVTLALLAGCQTKQSTVTPIPTPTPTPAVQDPFSVPAPVVVTPPPSGGDLTGPVIPDTTPRTTRTTTPTRTTSTTPTRTTTPATPGHTTTAAAAGKTYTVKKGDTLSSIAKQVYGNGNLYNKIVKANPGIDPNKIKVGQKITIPA